MPHPRFGKNAIIRIMYRPHRDDYVIFQTDEEGQPGRVMVKTLDDIKSHVDKVKQAREKQHPKDHPIHP